jgi:hypothetical protein
LQMPTGSRSCHFENCGTDLMYAFLSKNIMVGTSPSLSDGHSKLSTDPVAVSSFIQPSTLGSTCILWLQPPYMSQRRVPSAAMITGITCLRRVSSWRSPSRDLSFANFHDIDAQTPG